MFGKGIYFADMVSKSANYCCTNRTNNTGSIEDSKYGLTEKFLVKKKPIHTIIRLNVVTFRFLIIEILPDTGYPAK